VPDEDTVLLIAEKWSLNPQKLDDWEESTPLGILGLLQAGRFSA
jgi:hypothetical protein